MDKKERTPPPKVPEAHKNIVKDIFDRPKKATGRISTLFTHFKSSPKIISPTRKKSTLPSYVKPLPVAIDIGSSSIKIFRLGEGEKRSLQIICFDREGYGAAGTAKGTDFEKSVKKALKSLLEHNTMGTLCVSNLPMKNVQVYDMTFPPMSGDELASAIQYKVSQLKPFGLSRENITVRFKKWDIADAFVKAAQQRVIVVCVPKDIVAKRAALLKEVGFRPLAMEIPPFTLINLNRFHKPETLRDEVRLLVHIGEEESFLAIEKGGMLCFTKKIALTSKSMIKPIAKQCGVSEEEAETLKIKYGFTFQTENKGVSPSVEPGGTSSDKTPDRGEQIYYALSSLLENLVIDIEHSFKYFSYQVVQSQIAQFNRVVLSGGGSQLKNLDKFLNVRLGVPVENLNPFDAFRIPESVKNQRDELINEPGAFAVSTALSIGQKIEETERVNFLPKPEKKTFKVLQDALKFVPVQLAIVALAGATILFGIQFEKTGRYKAKMDLLTREVKRVKFQSSKLGTQELELAKEESDLIHQKELFTSQLELLREGFRGDGGVSNALRAIASLLPEEVWVTKLKYKDAQLTIAGSTVDMGVITKLIEGIKNSGEFTHADFSHTQREKDQEVYNFEIIATLKT